jgi:hypothetical protein
VASSGSTEAAPISKTPAIPMNSRIPASIGLATNARTMATIADATPILPCGLDMSMRPTSDWIFCNAPGREGDLDLVVDLTVGEPVGTDLVDASLVEESGAEGELVDADEVCKAWTKEARAFGALTAFGARPDFL